jgi:DNA-binding NtrC family response regulator
MNNSSVKILVVDDEPNIQKTLRKVLELNGYKVETADGGDAALNILEKNGSDIMITDLKMPGMSGMELFTEVQRRFAEISVIILTGHGTLEVAIEAMKMGAQDFLTKPCDPDRLLVTIDNIVEMRGLRREISRLRDEVWEFKRFGEIIGRDPKMQEIYRIINNVCKNVSCVYINGESGTGKELIARTIHQQGPNKDKPFVSIDCTGLSDQLMESQLFGHKKGAFTGAIQDFDGAITKAADGTLFLNDVSELSNHLQLKLLRAIQDGKFTPLGSQTMVDSHCRFITASSDDLQSRMNEGKFRKDLFFRLTVVRINIPPLRQRQMDIPLLVHHFIRDYSRKYGISPKQVEDDAMKVLWEYRWPGNIRELQNIIERSFALGETDVLSKSQLPGNLTFQGDDSLEGFEGFPRLEEAEKRLIERALKEAKGKKIRAAELLGIDRKRLYRKIKKYDLE